MPGKIPEESYSIEAIQKVHDVGCTFFDTAETYDYVDYYHDQDGNIYGFMDEVVITPDGGASSGKRRLYQLIIGG